MGSWLEQKARDRFRRFFRFPNSRSENLVNLEPARERDSSWSRPWWTPWRVD
jgi:hypothetical protein